MAGKNRRRSELAVQDLPEQPAGVVEAVGEPAGRASGVLCRGLRGRGWPMVRVQHPAR
jgi:hypothetical protein